MVSEEWENTCCKNCGHESHCGVPLHKDFRRDHYDHGVEGQIEVCKYCRCNKCSKPDWGQEIKEKKWQIQSVVMTQEKV